MPEFDALAAALAGNETGFNRLVEPHRVELHAHCYRMLRSVHDAEDALQDTLLRAWRGLPRFERQGSIRPWLYKIATNVCLDEIARRPRRSLPLDDGVPVDSPTDPRDERLETEGGFASPEARYEQREALELAFVAALRHLPGRQRAVLVLREVLAFSAREVAELLETSVLAVNSCLQRARKTIEERISEESQQTALRTVGNDGVRDLVDRFVNAFEAGDIEGILSLLAEDAAFAISPYANWYRGRDAVSTSQLMPGGPPPRLAIRRYPRRSRRRREDRPAGRTTGIWEGFECESA